MFNSFQILLFRGKVHIIDKNTQEEKLVLEGLNNFDHFGSSLAVWDNYLAVGSPYSDDTCLNDG